MQRRIQRKIYTVYGEGAVTDRTCQIWFARFHRSDITMVNALEDQPVDDDRIKVLETNSHMICEI